MPLISLIISTYKRPQTLARVLESVRSQYFSDFEVIIAEDDCAPEIHALVAKTRESMRNTIKHCSQEDQGFRKCRILNAALREANGEYMVFVDADCLLHPSFLHEYARNVAPDRVLWGRRVLLSQSMTDAVLAGARISLSRFLEHRCRRIEDSLYLPRLPPQWWGGGILGSNWCMHRQTLIDINGFDEDFERYGIGEDTAIEWRLKAVGLKFRSIRNKAIQYHLWHPHNERPGDIAHNLALLEGKQRQGEIYCRSGLNQPSMPS